MGLQKIVDDMILEHVGVKGMRWGIRKSEVTVSSRGKKLKTSGGRGVPAHPDALRAHKIGQIVKKSGSKSVSNQDLKTYADRLQLEQNVSRLTSQPTSRSTKFIKDVLSQSGKSLASEGVNKGAKEVGKRALVFAKSKRSR